ncbi:MAG TPA: ABC transporter permease [Candidatus Angelobacter sp.]|nr:ABC transporter permease [Candidatus Angelobacter sp.]
MESFIQDIRYGIRQLRKAPGFAVIAVLSLAVGIGATTAVFSIVYATLLHPYPFRDWERLVTLTVQEKSDNTRFVRINGEQLRQLRAANVVEEVVAFDRLNLVTTGALGEGDLPEDVNTVRWTTNALDYFGVPPVMGRGFVSSDAPEGQEPQPVAMLSYLFWQRHFGGDKNIVGQTIELTHVKYQIVGVLSQQINWAGGDVYLPLKVTGDPGARLDTSIRLRPGVSPEVASGALQPLLEAFARSTPLNFPQGFKANILPLSNGIKTGLGPSLYLLFGAVFLLLLVACLNVSILLLARGTRRQYELAVRAAMGAARARVVRQLLTEALLVALVGEGLGIALAVGLQRLVVNQLPYYLENRRAMIHLNVPVLAFSIAATLITVVLFGLLPGVQLSRRRDPRNAMQTDSTRMAGGWGKQTRNALIAGQVALSLVLVASAGTSVHAFMSLLHTDLGYDPHDTMILATPLHPNDYTTWESRAAFFDRIQQKLASTPDVTSVAIGMAALPPVNGFETWFEIMGQNTLGDQQVRSAFVSPEYFSTLRIQLLRGRIFDRTEVARGERLGIINQTMARRYFPHTNPLGQKIRLPRLVAAPPDVVAPPDSDQWIEIVGVAADALNNGLRDPVLPAVYLPYTLSMPTFPGFLVRTRGNPMGMLRTMRMQVQEVAAGQQVARNAMSLEDYITRQDDWQREHMVAILFGAFACITLLLAGIGLYSVVSYSVAQRTREFAIRMALGAQRGHVLRDVFFSIAGVVLAGTVAGIGLQLAVGRIVAQWAYSSGRDPIVIAMAAPLLILVALVACYWPARRAISVEPTQALRYD